MDTGRRAFGQVALGAPEICALWGEREAVGAAPFSY